MLLFLSAESGVVVDMWNPNMTFLFFPSMMTTPKFSLNVVSDVGWSMVTSLLLMSATRMGCPATFVKVLIKSMKIATTATDSTPVCTLASKRRAYAYTLLGAPLGGSGKPP